jgi:hypothetical protein
MLLPQNGMMTDPTGEWLKQGHKLQTFRAVGLNSSHSLAIFPVRYYTSLRQQGWQNAEPARHVAEYRAWEKGSLGRLRGCLVVRERRLAKNELMGPPGGW